MEKQNVVFDFDGVINSYSSGWCDDDSISAPPTPGIKEAIAEIREKYRVIIVSTRCANPGGERAIREYLARYGIEVDGVAAVKPRARCYIDDKAICFDGDAAGLLEKIDGMNPWHKSHVPSSKQY